MIQPFAHKIPVVLMGQGYEHIPKAVDAIREPVSAAVPHLEDPAVNFRQQSVRCVISEQLVPNAQVLSTGRAPANL